MADRSNVYAVVLNWNEPEKTCRCVRSIQEQDDSVKVIVVDNGSVDGSVEHILRACQEATLLCNEQNLGFAAGVNVGIHCALGEGADLIWLLNNDAVAQPGALVGMVEASSAPSVGIVGSVLHPPDAPSVIAAWGGGHVRPWLGTTSRAIGPPARPLDYITGGSMLLKSSMLRETGLFDETFFLYLEDADLSLRVRDAGWRLAVADTSHVLHEGGGSSRGERRRPAWIDDHLVFSSGVFIAKHGGSVRTLGVIVRLLGIILVRIRRLQIPRLPHIIVMFLRGYGAGRART